MSDDVRISVEKRTEFGKGAARRIRRADKIPAVLYGHGEDPIHVTMPGHETMMALKVQNAVMTLDIEGDEKLALAKDVQRDPIKPIIEHVDLVIVRKGEKVSVEVPVHVEGESAPETNVSLENATIGVLAEATHIPEEFVVSVEGMEAGSHITAAEVKLPKGVELESDPEMLVVNVTQMVSEEELEAELEAAEDEAGIEKEEHDEDAEGGDSDGESEGGDEESSDD